MASIVQKELEPTQSGKAQAHEVRSYPGGDAREVWVEVRRRGFQSQTLLKTKIVHFATLFKSRDFTL